MIYKYLFILTLLIMPVSACPFDNQGHWVRMQFVDANNTPVEGFVIIQQKIQDTTESWWIMTLLGYSYQEYQAANERAQYRLLQTDSNGYITTPMYETLRYNITIYNRTTYGEIMKYTIYPRESEYKFTVE